MIQLQFGRGQNVLVVSTFAFLISCKMIFETLRSKTPLSRLVDVQSCNLPEASHFLCTKMATNWCKIRFARWIINNISFQSFNYFGNVRTFVFVRQKNIFFIWWFDESIVPQNGRQHCGWPQSQLNILPMPEIISVAPLFWKVPRN